MSKSKLQTEQKSKLEKLVQRVPLKERMGRRSIAPNLSYDFEKNAYYYYLGKHTNKKGKMVPSYISKKDPVEMEQLMQEYEKLDTPRAKHESAINTRETVGQYLLSYIANQRYAEAATEGYYHQCRKRIVAELGDTLLYQLTTDDIEGYLTKRLKKYAPETVCKDYDFLRMALKKAVATRKILYDPALAVCPPRKARNDMRNLIEYYQPVDVKKIIEGCEKNLYKDNFFHNEDENNIYARAILLALYTGMRRGEVCGLKYSDLYLDAPTPYLRVERSRTDTCGGYETQVYETKSTKTISSIRNIALFRNL